VNVTGPKINLNPSEPDPACETLSQRRYNCVKVLLRENSVLVACTVRQRGAQLATSLTLMTELFRKHFEDCPPMSTTLKTELVMQTTETPTHSHPPQATHCHPAGGNQCSPRRQRSGLWVCWAQPYDDGADVAGTGRPFRKQLSDGSDDPPGHGESESLNRYFTLRNVPYV